MDNINTILVTGGAGYIGSHVCKALSEAGLTPITYDNFQGGHRWAVQFGPLIEGDIHDTEKLKKTLDLYQPAAVFHLASSINVRESLSDPLKYYHNNVQGTLSLLKAMVESGTTNIVFSSTASVYGNPLETPLKEDHPKRPLHAYGKSKYMVELLLEDFEKAYGIKSVVMRYFNACGADKDGLIGEAHSPETHLIPLVIQTALRQKECLDIYGDTYPTFDGTAIRDYIHVSDLADAHLKALYFLIEKKESLRVNLGTETGFSIRQIIETVEAISGKKVRTNICAPSPDACCLVASSKLANEKLKWYPKNSTIENIIETALAWHTKKVEAIL
ncbi:MAG: UDP-glucose 4-epimerase GalE [Chlamydiae bacterium]|nr:UDP-glucose 4-epimerase GalE [Chlamydiota bacterium]